MRPRPEDRGERRTPGASPFTLPPLQCGHGPKTVENAVPLARSRDVRSRFASMRPRPEDRGEPLWRQSFIADLDLLSFNAATAPRPWRTPHRPGIRVPIPKPKLQCGHGPKTVENSVQYSRPSLSSSEPGFNAATARRPWRTESDASKSTVGLAQNFNAATARRPWRTLQLEATFFLDQAEPELLQCGHGPKTVENAACVWSHLFAFAPCFNAATARRPWRTRGSAVHCAQRRGPRFNAATARRPWRT